MSQTLRTLRSFGKPLTIAEIAAAARINRRTVAKALHRLTTARLVVTAYAAAPDGSGDYKYQAIKETQA
jgi:predicted transcriptional regulator